MRLRTSAWDGPTSWPNVPLAHWGICSAYSAVESQSVQSVSGLVYQIKYANLLCSKLVFVVKFVRHRTNLENLISPCSIATLWST